MRKVLFVPDTHRPNHDKRAWALFLKANRIWKPDVIIVLGDFADMACVSRHPKKPTISRDLQREIDDVNRGLDELDSLGATERYWVGGNHEDRLDRYMSDNAPELYNITNVAKLLRLKERGWKVTPYKRALKFGKMHITHDLEKAGPNAHTDARAAFEGCAVIGHTHRMSVTYSGNVLGHTKVGAMFGWLGSVEKAADYKHRSRACREWVHGWGIGYIDDSGVVYLQAVPIIKGKVCIDGRVIAA